MRFGSGRSSGLRSVSSSRLLAAVARTQQDLDDAVAVVALDDDLALLDRPADAAALFEHPPQRLQVGRRAAESPHERHHPAGTLLAEGDTAYVGITDFAQSQLGDIVFVDVPTEGETVAAGEVFGTIEAVKTVSDAFLPVSGEIVEFNAAVDADPSIVNKDPYGEGWLVKVRVSDPAEYDTLLTAEQYTELIG